VSFITSGRIASLWTTCFHISGEVSAVYTCDTRSEALRSMKHSRHCSARYISFQLAYTHICTLNMLLVETPEGWKLPFELVELETLDKAKLKVGPD